MNKDMNAIDIVRQMVTDGQVSQEVAEKYFPELKESEDEKIRERLIAFLSQCKAVYGDGFQQFELNIDEALAYLEKQGENHVVVTNEMVKPAEEVEPKFKVGDWLVSPNGVYWHIDAINNNRYEVSSTDGTCADWPLNTNLYHLWTIEDAKNGDVLAVTMYPEGTWAGIFKEQDGCTFSSHCFLSTDGIFKKGTYGHGNGKAIRPATKEQRDLLFKKMHEAGYEWDAEKKELKKIEQKSWSEEEFRHIVGYLVQDIVANEHMAETEKQPTKFFVEKYYKKLRPQSTWKPSEEMLEALYRAIPKNVKAISEDEMLLDKLYQGLKYGKVFKRLKL